MLAPNGHLVTKAIHEKHTHKEYIGVDACAVNFNETSQCTGHTITSQLWVKKTNQQIMYMISQDSLREQR